MMTLLPRPKPEVTARSVVYDTPSGMGGTFTVQIVERDGERCKVQTIYGSIDALTHRFRPWDDCLEFWTTADKLSNERRLNENGSH